MVVPSIDLIIASVLGIGTGVVLQKGRVCSNSAFRNLLIIKNSELALILVITVTVEIIGYYLLSVLNPLNIEFTSNPIEFSLLFLPIGAFIFGLGTVVAGGCAGGTCYRIGEGSIKSLLAFFGFALGIGVLAVGPISDWFWSVRADTLWTIDNQTPSLEFLLPRGVWTILAIIILIGSVIWYIALQRKNKLSLVHLLPRWTPIISGILLGLFGILVKLFSSLPNVGRNFGLSTVDGIGDIFINLLNLQIPGWAGFFIVSLILGSALSSFQGQEFKLKFPNQLEIIRYFGGGLVLGLGAMMASGCNFGHIFGGIPELGLSSIVAALLMIIGNWTGSYLFYQRFNQDLPKSTPLAI